MNKIEWLVVGAILILIACSGFFGWFDGIEEYFKTPVPELTFSDLVWLLILNRFVSWRKNEY